MASSPLPSRRLDGLHIRQPFFSSCIGHCRGPFKYRVVSADIRITVSDSRPEESQSSVIISRLELGGTKTWAFLISLLTRLTAMISMNHESVSISGYSLATSRQILRKLPSVFPHDIGFSHYGYSLLTVSSRVFVGSASCRSVPSSVVWNQPPILRDIFALAA